MRKGVSYAALMTHLRCKRHGTRTGDTNQKTHRSGCAPNAGELLKEIGWFETFKNEPIEVASRAGEIPHRTMPS